MPAKPNPDGYVHARDDKEYQRLRDQAAMWRPATEAVLGQDRRLKPGMSSLDIGCGPGAVMRLRWEIAWGLQATSPASMSTVGLGA